MKKNEINIDIDENGTLKSNVKCAIKTNSHTKKRLLIFPKFNIKKLNNGLFEGYCKAQEICVPEQVENIGKSCFAKCTSLEKMIIPDSVTELGENCFQFCNNLKCIKLSENLQNIPEYCFYSCSSLEEITLPEKLTTLEQSCFSGCSKLKNIKCPQNLKQIGKHVFSHCHSLEEFEFNNNITHIPEGLLSYCKNLKKVVLPQQLKSIDYLGFEACTSLENISFPNTLEYIGEKAFTECDSLTQLTIPENVERIDFYAFENCRNLQKVKILSNNIENIEEGAFYGCYNISELYIPKGMLRNDIFDFEYMKNLKKITYDNKQILNINEDEKLENLINNGKYIDISYINRDGKLIHKVIKDEKDIINNMNNENKQNNSNNTNADSTMDTEKFLTLYNHKTFSTLDNDYKKTNICLNMMSILDFETCVHFLDLLTNNNNYSNNSKKNDAEKIENIKENSLKKILNKINLLLHKKDIKKLPTKTRKLENNFLLETLFKNAEIKNNSKMFDSFFSSNINEIANINNSQILQKLCDIQRNFNYFMNDNYVKGLIDSQEFTLENAIQYYDLCVPAGDTEFNQEKRISKTQQLENEIYEETARNVISIDDEDDFDER